MANEFDNELETPDMEALSSLAENLVYKLPGCDNLMIRKTIQEVYRDFCRRSCCLCGRRHFVVTSDDYGLPITPMFGGVVDCVVDVIFNGRHLHRRDYAETNGSVILADRFIPSEDCPSECFPKVDVMFVEMPKINSELAPSWFIQKHGESICSGVLARLMSMTGKAWFDSNQATVENVRYENAINEARVRFYSWKTNGDCGMVSSTSDLI